MGYCIAVDRYMKQDHVGQFIQLNVAPGSRRGLVGAALVRAAFERSAWGVKLFGLWCRQDLAANRFWESLGFVPLAFRTAGFAKLREIERKTGGTAGGVHIYWQKRIRPRKFDEVSQSWVEDDTAYWFPFETQGGLMAESRVVLPIPPGMTWEQVRPAVLPGAERREAEARRLESPRSVEDKKAEQAELARLRKEAREAKQAAAKEAQGPAVVHGVAVSGGKVAAEPTGFALPPEVVARREAEAKAAAAEAKKRELAEAKKAARAEAKRARRQSDPELLKFSRELRDRWQEAVAAEPGLIGLGCAGKYEVGRVIEGAGAVGIEGGSVRRLGAA